MLAKNILTTCPPFMDETNLLLINESPELEYPDVYTFPIDKFISGG